MIYFQRDAVPSEDVRVSIVTRRLAAAEENSVEKEELQRELVRLINVNNSHRISMIEIDF